MPTIDLVIPSYGGPIRSTRDHVLSMSGPDTMYVIDNAGRLQKHDDEPEYGVVIVRPGRNIGWEAGLNVGTAMSDADYVIWMNDDVRPQTPDWHKLLVEPMEIDKRIGLVGPRVRGHANYQGRIPEDAELTTLVDVSPHQHTEGRMPHFRMSFFCVAVRRKVWHDVGPVDDRFSVPATGRRGGDDYDYCWRAHLKHWDMVMRTDVWVNHVDQGQTYRMLNATADNTPLLKEKWGWE